MKDLFGQEVVEAVGLISATGKPKRDETPKGYAARPGSGPSGEFCRTCANAVRVDGRYWKCELLRRNWSACYTTDIRLKAPACSYWKPKL